MVRIPAEHVDIAFGVTSLCKVEERSLFKFECGAVGWRRGRRAYFPGVESGGCAEVRVYMRTAASAFVVPVGGTRDAWKPPAPARP